MEYVKEAFTVCCICALVAIKLLQATSTWQQKDLDPVKTYEAFQAAKLESQPDIFKDPGMMRLQAEVTASQASRETN